MRSSGLPGDAKKDGAQFVLCVRNEGSSCSVGTAESLSDAGR